ncbi:MAG: hypothetical protein JSW59_17755 [Phycisphaerales bacterium]|nr:MAG: hypothetical protein JSW59_17755 [Phycisphaerales bacterium]
MAVKRAFILGAGFSKQAGLPLATELTPLILDRFKEHNQDEMLAWFDWLEKRIAWLEKASSETSPSINIERVFDLAHFDAHCFSRSKIRIVLRVTGPLAKRNGIMF